MDPLKVPKNCQQFICENCDYITSRKSHMNAHILTAKHMEIVNGPTKVPKNCQHFICEKCGH